MEYETKMSDLGWGLQRDVLTFEQAGKLKPRVDDAPPQRFICIDLIFLQWRINLRLEGP